MKWGSIAVFALVLAVACEPDTTTRVVDGEHVIVKGRRITLHLLDAPEGKDAKCDREERLAALTEERLAGLLLAAKVVEFREAGTGCVQTQSCEGVVMADGQDVGKILIGEGLAVRGVIEKGAGVTHDWCANAGADDSGLNIAPDAPPPEN